MPFDIYRVALFAALSIIGSILFIIDLFAIYPNIDGTGFFKINYGLISPENWWILLIITISAIPLYMGIETISVKLYDSIRNRRKVVKQ